MDSGGFFSGIGEVIDKIKKPPDLFLFVGLGLFGWGVVKGPFSIDNAMIAWGLVCITAAMTIKLFAESVSWMGDTYRDYRFIHWWNMIGGSLFAAGCAVLIFHQFAHHWVPFHK
jgi:hypothetical protein